MKAIKKITLKDAKVLSDSELRNITGGYDSDTKEDPCKDQSQENCSATCYVTIVVNKQAKKMEGACGWSPILYKCGCEVSTVVP